VDGYKACYAIYYQSSNSMYLLNDNGSQWLGGSAPGTAGATVSNSQCTLNIQNSSTSLSGNNLSVTFAVTFISSFIGPQQVFALTSDASGQNSGWQDEGIWTGYAAPSSQPPCTPASSCTVTPTGQTGMSAAFTFTSSDLNGAAYMPQEFLVLGSYSANSCVVLVYHESNAAYLLSDDASAWNPIPAGGSLANSQCAISGTSGSNSGNNWIYGLTATFAAGYGGAKPIYMQVWDHGLQTSGLLQVGTWTVGTPESITMATNPPGLSVTVDGTAYASPQTFSLAAGSQHVISTASPQTAGTGNQYVFSSWSDGQAASHTITVPSAAATYTATFAAVDFTITVTPTASPSVAMAGGNGATYTVTVGALNGFSGTVTLTPPPRPSGFTATFGTSTITGAGSTTMTITAPSGSTGNIAISVTGTSGQLTHTASGGTLAVQDFTATLSPAYPSSVTAGTNSQATWTVVTSGLNGFTQPITLTYSTLYSYSATNIQACSTGTALFLYTGYSGASVNPGQTATLALSTGSALQYECSFQIFAAYGGTTHTMTGWLNQQGTGDFVLTQPASQTVTAGSAVTFQAAYTPILGFSGTVNFSVAGLPSGAAVTSFSPLSSPLQGDSIAVSVAAGVTSGTYPVTITATSGSITHTEVTQLVVQGGPDFTLTTSPSVQTIQQNGSATYTVSLTPLAGFTGAVTLSMGSIPAGTGVSARLSTTTISANSPATMTLTATSTATLGAYRIQVNGAYGSDTHYAIAPLLVTLGKSPGTTIALGSIPVQVPPSGQSVPATTVLSPLPAGETLSAAGCTPPSGVNVTVSPVQGSAFAQSLNIAASAGLQVPSSGTLSCATSAGRTVKAQLQFGDQENVGLSATPQGGGVYDFNVQTQGFSEVDNVILVGSNGMNDDDGLYETYGDVSLDFSQYIPAGSCVNYSAFVWGFAEGGDDPGAAYASASGNVCDAYEPPAQYYISGYVTANGKGLANVTLTTSNASYTTDATGYYYIPVTPGSNVTVLPSYHPPPLYALYTIPFAPADAFFYNVQGNITKNFSTTFTTVLLVHGIGQDHTAMQQLA
jgi:hypothetical protein